MGAFLTSLASIANQYGEAKDAARQEQEAKAQKFRQMDVQDSYLQIAKQAEERQAQESKERIATGDLIKIGNRLWSVSKGQYLDPQSPNPMDSLKQFIATLPKDVQPGAAARAKTIVEADPNDPKAAITEVMRYVDAQKAEANRREDEATRHKEHEEDRQDTKTFQRGQRQEMEAFQKNMVDWRLADKQKYMTPVERQAYDAIKQVEPSVQRTIDFLEQTKNSDGQPLKEENAYAFGDRSALMQHLRFKGYKFGTKQEDISQQLIKNAAVIQVLGARPWMSMGRGKFIYETISQHLPAPTDTPANMYDKLVWLRDNVLLDAKDSLAGYVTPGGANSNDPLGVFK